MDYGSISVCAKRIHFARFLKIVAAAAAAAPGLKYMLLLLDLFISNKPILRRVHDWNIYMQWLTPSHQMVLAVESYMESQELCLKWCKSGSRTATASAVAALLVVFQVDPKRNLVMKVLIKSMSAAVERITTPFALIVWYRQPWEQNSYSTRTPTPVPFF